MIVYQVHIHGFAIAEPENNAPIAAHSHAPVSGQVSTQQMQPEAGIIQFFGFLRYIQSRKNPRQPRGQIGGNAPAVQATRKMESP